MRREEEKCDLSQDNSNSPLTHPNNPPPVAEWRYAFPLPIL